MVMKNPKATAPSATVSFSGKGVLLGMRRLALISLFIIPFGIAFGVAATEQGLSPLQTTVMSALVYSATAQFAALDFLNEPIAYVSMGLVVLALSGRHVIMGAAVAGWVNQLPIGRRIVTLALMSDANFADTLPSLKRGQTDLGVLLGGGLMLWLTWVGSTALGAFGGDQLGDTDAYGFGAVMLCFFAATAVGMVRATSGLILPVCLAMAVSVLTLHLLPVGWNIIVAAITGGLCAMWLCDE